MALSCLYVDLDGTLLGRGASLLHDGEGAFTLLGVRALEACARADVEVALYSGRRRAQLFDNARMLGVAAYAFEAGAGLVVDGEVEYLTDPFRPEGGRTVHRLIEETGAPTLLLERFAGRLEYHDPWHRDREVSHLLRGRVDVAEAEALLREHGLGDLRLIDNGAIRRRSRTLAGVDAPHAYHLVPAGVSKARAVDRHRAMRGYARADCLAVGDSREDLGVAAAVETFWLVANALRADPGLRDLLPRVPNVRVAEEAHGAGVYEAVITTLAERRAAA